MKKTQHILMTVFALICAIVVVLYAYTTMLQGEFPSIHASEGTRFALSCVCILLTLCTIPFALKLFKFKRIERDLQTRKSEALLQWGLLRMSMVGFLLLANILLYYLLEEEPTFGWLSVILILILPFIVPTMSRCEAETAQDEPAVVEGAEAEQLETDYSNEA